MKYVYRLRILDKRTDETICVEEVSEHQKLGLLHFMAKIAPYRNKDHRILSFETNDLTSLNYVKENDPKLTCTLVDQID